jgi:hypothetical protein
MDLARGLRPVGEKDDLAKPVALADASHRDLAPCASEATQGDFASLKEVTTFRPRPLLENDGSGSDGSLYAESDKGGGAADFDVAP